jgi:GNAT superfamily N-acetyltransferase
MLTVRKATGKDAESILRLAKELYSELGHRLSIGDHESVPFCKAILESGEYVVFLSDGPQGYPNGIITLSEGLSIYAGGKFGVIREFYVIPEMRSTGVGKALLEKAKEFGRRSGWKRIEVTPPDKGKWSRTYDFYIREGFAEIGPRLKLENLDVRPTSG